MIIRIFGFGTCIQTGASGDAVQVESVLRNSTTEHSSVKNVESHDFENSSNAYEKRVNLCFSDRKVNVLSNVVRYPSFKRIALIVCLET